MIWNISVLFRLIGISFSIAWAEEAVETQTDYRVASTIHKIRQSPSVKSPLRGIVYAGDVFSVGAIAGYKDCEAGWASVSDGYICLIGTKKVEKEPIALPTSLDILPPVSSSSPGLISVSEENPAFMPTLHGKRDKEHKGRLWKSIASYENGDVARWRLSENRDYRFIAAHQTSKGWVLERPNGSIAPLSDVYLYPSSRFSGRDVSVFPVSEQAQPAFVMNKEGVPLYWEAKAEAEALLQLEYRRPIDVQPIASDEQDRQEKKEEEDWWQVPMGELVGYVPREDIRLWSALERPESIADDEIWIDADIKTQMLAVMKGDVMLYLTLMSSAKKGHKTPLGSYRIYDKSTGWDLGSLDGADDEYFMERVPYVMHYYPRYAIHSSFWHDDFGEPASHGCLNLSVQDAKIVFDLVSPDLPKGWRYVKQSKKHLGTVVRVRQGDKEGRSKKIAPK